MAEDYEATAVIGEYEDATEALAIQAALKEAGIEAILTGDVASVAGPDWVAGRLNYEPIRLAVPASQQVAAAQVLESLDEETEPDWEEAAESAIDGWLCRNCDTVMAASETACTECGTLRSEQPPEDGAAEDSEPGA